MLACTVHSLILLSFEAICALQPVLSSSVGRTLLISHFPFYSCMHVLFIFNFYISLVQFLMKALCNLGRFLGTPIYLHENLSGSLLRGSWTYGIASPILRVTVRLGQSATWGHLVPATPF